MKREVGGKRKAKSRREEAAETVKVDVVKATAKVKEEELIFGLNERQILLFLMEFLVVSALFLAVWYYIGEFYQGAIFFVARHILLLMGYTPVQIAAVNLSGAYLVNFNLVPLVALAIATPKLVVRRRIELLAIGIPLLFLLHVLDLVAHFPIYFYGSGVAQFVVYSIGVGGVAIPFIIWFVIAFFFRRFRKETCVKET